MPKAKPMYFSGSMATVAQHVRMDHAAAGDLQPFGLRIAPLMNATSISARGFGERKERRTKAHLQVVALEEATQEVCDHRP